MIFAYLDAGSGSMLLQAVLGGAAGVGVAFKAWRQRRKAKDLGGEVNTDNAGEDAGSDETS